jgi:transposase
MVGGGFLTDGERRELRALARDGLSESRVTRRANAIVLLDDGWTYEEVAKALLIDDDTVRAWHRLYEEQGLVGLAVFHFGGGLSRLSAEQESALKAWAREALPANTSVVGAWIKATFGLDYSHAGLIALMHRLGMVYRKPELVRPDLDPARQQAFIDLYNRVLNSLGPDEAVMFGDAVHPTHQVRPAGCWAPKDEAIAIPPSSGRERVNIHGAIDLETGQTQMVEAPTVNAQSTIALLIAILAANPDKRRIHVFLDNARYHHAKLVKQWLKTEEGRRIKLHFVPPYCPHLNSIERLWGVAHKYVTHNKGYATFAQFKAAMLDFLRDTVPRRWDDFRTTVTDNFRVINPADFRILA